MEFVNLKTGEYVDIVKWTGKDFPRIQTELNKYYLDYYDYPRYEKDYSVKIVGLKTLKVRILDQDNEPHINRVHLGQYLLVDGYCAKTLSHRKFKRNYKKPHIISGYAVNKKTNYSYPYTKWTGDLNCLSEKSTITNAGGLFGTPFLYHVNQKHQLCFKSTYDKATAKINVGDYILEKYPSHLSIYDGFIAFSPQYMKAHYRLTRQHVRTIGLNEHKTVAEMYVETPQERHEDRLFDKLLHDTKYCNKITSHFYKLGQKAMKADPMNDHQLSQIMYQAHNYLMKYVPGFEGRFLELACGNYWTGRKGLDRDYMYKSMSQVKVVRTCQFSALDINQIYGRDKDRQQTAFLIGHCHNWVKGLNGSTVPVHMTDKGLVKD